MRRILGSVAVVLAAGAFLLLTLGSSSQSSGATYKIELQNAFGLVNGSVFKVAGVQVGKVDSMDLCKYVPGSHCQNNLDALVTVSVNTKGFGQFRSDAFCQSRPQSLIGEYFLDCDPGSGGKVLKSGATIPVSNTQSTIPADLVQNVMRLPYRERFTLIINELGAAVAARSMDIQTALRRADPALAETDNLLALLANDNKTIRDLNVGANQVIRALAVNNTDVTRFIVQANNAAQDSASPQANPRSCGTDIAASCIEAGWNKLPGFLEQLRPALFRLGQASDAQDPVFTNLNEAASNLTVFFHRLVPFSNESVPSLQSLGQASVVGKPAVQAALPTVRDLSRLTGGTGCQAHDLNLDRHPPSQSDPVSGFINTCLPELAQNLALTLGALDARKPIPGKAGGAVEPDPRSPDGGIGYTGLEGLLEYAFDITNAVNSYTQWGHQLAVDAFASTTCSPYATPQTIANNIANYKKGGGNLNDGNNSSNPRTCYAYLGPNQPAVNEPDPSWSPSHATPANPSPCVPDPGGYPVMPPVYGVHYYGPSTNACQLGSSTGTKNFALTNGSTSSGAGGSAQANGTSGAQSTSSASSKVGQIVSQVTGSGATGTAQGAGAPAAAGASDPEVQQLLNYLLAP